MTVKVTPEPFIPHSTAARLVPSGVGSVSNTAYQPWPPAGVGGPVQVTGFVKQRSDTKLIVSIFGSGYPVTVTGHLYTLGVRVNAANSDVHVKFANEVINNEHDLRGGEIEITGVPAGTYTIYGRHKGDNTGTSAYQTDTNDSWTIQVTETL